MKWKTAYLESRVLSATPVELISILYEYAALSIQEARAGLAGGDIAARSKAILKVIAILGELESSLDHELGGEIASNLGRLYRYMRERLTAGNLHSADAPFAEVEGLFKTLGEAWQTIARNKTTSPNPADGAVIPAWNSAPMNDPMLTYSAHTWSA